MKKTERKNKTKKLGSSKRSVKYIYIYGQNIQFRKIQLSN